MRARTMGRGQRDQAPLAPGAATCKAACAKAAFPTTWSARRRMPSKLKRSHGGAHRGQQAASSPPPLPHNARARFGPPQLANSAPGYQQELKDMHSLMARTAARGHRRRSDQADEVPKATASTEAKKRVHACNERTAQVLALHCVIRSGDAPHDASDACRLVADLLKLPVPRAIAATRAILAHGEKTKPNCWRSATIGLAPPPFGRRDGRGKLRTGRSLQPLNAAHD